jgi:protein-S-isoprenylcysteine O-methyltransferase Ste14
MRRRNAAVGSAVFLLLAPGVVAGVIPWLLTDWQSTRPPLLVKALGGVLVVAGAMVVLLAFARFVSEGEGTPAPVAPTQRLVVGGLYRYVRNPMYVPVGTTIIGQALLLGRPSLLGYAAIFYAVVIAFVHGYEEPLLTASAPAERCDELLVIEAGTALLGLVGEQRVLVGHEHVDIVGAGRCGRGARRVAARYRQPVEEPERMVDHRDDVILDVAREQAGAAFLELLAERTEKVDVRLDGDGSGADDDAVAARRRVCGHRDGAWDC